MSTDDIILSVCANCGKGEEDSDKLKACTTCKVVKYCNRECQIAHRPQHKKECREREAELHNEKLFAEPPSQHGDCPISFLRLPSLRTGYRYKSCCGKDVCSGCYHAPVYDNQGNEVDNKKCAHCRTPWPSDDEEATEREKKRMKVNDPKAIFNIGSYYARGIRGFPKDMDKALELYHRAGDH